MRMEFGGNCSTSFIHILGIFIHKKTIIINHRLLSINHSDNPVAMVWKLRYNMEKSLTFDTTNTSCTCKFKSETDFSCVLSIYCSAPQTKQANIRELVRYRIYKPLGFSSLLQIMLLIWLPRWFCNLFTLSIALDIIVWIISNRFVINCILKKLWNQLNQPIKVHFSTNSSRK